MVQLTKYCKHPVEKDCVHCTEGCMSCGVLELSEEGEYCDDCTLDRAILQAESLFEGER